jgi:hypothetical protein
MSSFYMQWLAKALRTICKAFPNGALNLKNLECGISLQQKAQKNFSVAGEIASGM